MERSNQCVTYLPLVIKSVLFWDVTLLSLVLKLSEPRPFHFTEGAKADNVK